MEEIFVYGSWIFLDDGTFFFAPSANADVRDDLFPIFGNYIQDNNTLLINGERNSFGASASIDGTISLTEKEPHLDIIYSISSHSYNIVKISQILTPKNIKLAYDLPVIEIEGITIPSTYKIALQGEIDGKSFDSLYGFIKIKPNNNLEKHNNPFVLTLQIYAPDKNGNLEWSSEELFSSSSSEMTINNNQISLKLKPSVSVFNDLNWWAVPTGYAKNVTTDPVVVTGTEGNLTFTIEKNQVSGTITTTGYSAASQISTYQAKFTGERETKPPSFQGVWQENKFLQPFGDINLEQSGQKVTGTYSGNGGGVIEGIANENRLDFTWKDTKKKGEGFFRLTSHGKFLTGIMVDEMNLNQKQSLVAERTKESYPNLIAPELANDKWYLSDLGINLMLQHRYDEALMPLEAAQKLHNDDQKFAISSTSKNYNYLLDQASLIRNLTRSYFQTKNYKKLVESLENAIEVQRLINKDQPYNSTSYEINSTRSQLNRYIESWRINLTQDKDKIAALDQAQPFFYNLITYLVELDSQDNNSLTPKHVKSRNLEVALLASENARARAFADLLENQGSSNSIQTIAAKSPTIKQIKTIAKEQNATLVEYWVDEVKTSDNTLSPESKIYIWVIQPNGKIDFKSVDLKLSNQSLAQFVAETREFMGLGKEDGEEKDKNKIVVKEEKTRGNSVESIFKPGDLVRLKTDLVEYLREVVNVYPERNAVTVRFVNELERPPREVQISELIRVYAPINIRLQQSYQLLIDPIAELLPANPEAKVIFIPHRELFLLPFPALQDRQGQYLIDQHAIVTSPAIQILESTHQQQKQIRGKAKETIVVGNPSPMPGNFASIKGTEEEANTVARQLKVQPLTGMQATEKNVRQRLTQAKLIHLATHGTFNDKDPLQGLIALAPSTDGYDGLLTAEKILNLDDSLNAELVVLSACDTGRGKISGDGVIGLSRSWMAAGVPSMIVSLWQVPDQQGTPLLMKTFYRKNKNLDKAQALREAMLTTKAKYPEPKYWAAFTLIGEAE